MKEALFRGKRVALFGGENAARHNIFFAIAIYRYYEPESWQSLNQMFQEAHSWRGVKVEMWEQSNIIIARNYFAREFIENKAYAECDYFFLFDVDTVCFTPGAIDMMIDAGKPIIGGAYVMKKLPLFPVFVPYDPIDFDLRKKEKPFAVKYSSGGFMLIRRAVMEAVYNKFNGEPFELMKDSTGLKLSEDWAFCCRAKKLGYDTFIHPKITLGHLGKYPYTILDFYTQYIDNPEVKEFDIQGMKWKREPEQKGGTDAKTLPE